jgi:hypothetical protein
MKAYDVVGFAWEGDTYCAGCFRGNGDDADPIFAGDETAAGCCCGHCGLPLIDDDNPSNDRNADDNDDDPDDDPAGNFPKYRIVVWHGEARSVFYVVRYYPDDDDRD